MLDIASIKEIKIIKQNERQKVILTQDIDGKKYLKRVLLGDKREIYKTLAKINHPNIPKIYYIGLDEDTTIIEEYIDGKTLSEFIERGKQLNKKLNKKQLSALVNQILSAMESLHKSDIIHRDIKPDNILIDEWNHIWLTDFDIARIYRQEVRRDTEAMGTFGYAPIEQYGMFPTDFKTDIYAFGVTLKTLLDESEIKGFLHRIADKCKRLDPSERYKSVSAVKKAIKFGKYKWQLVCTIALFVVSGIIYIICNGTNGDINTVSKEQIEESVTDVLKQAEADKLSFVGFEEGETEAEYSKYGTFPYVCIFTFNKPWEHIIFTDDMNKKGTIKMGVNRSVINADITLHDGELSVNLDDGEGKTFSKKFKYNGEYAYSKEYDENLRKNADIVCFDLDGDGGDELLIGLNEGTIGVVGENFYNNFNYCMGWCVKYDEKDGFILCDGNMFSLKYGFNVNTAFRNLGISWEDMDDIKGYRLKENKILPFY